MKKSIPGVIALSILSLALIGCSQSTPPAAKAQTGDPAAGKVIAESACKACHGLDGKGVAPAIPNLAAQREHYLYNSLKEYKDGKRSHAALKNMTSSMSEADLHNVAAYFAGLPPIAKAAAGDVKHSSPYEKGKAIAAACAKCHGEDGNSTIPGT